LTTRKAATAFALNDFPLIRINPFDSETEKDNQISIQMSAKDFLLSL
jgi:hypothetical protein